MVWTSAWTRSPPDASGHLDKTEPVPRRTGRTRTELQGRSQAPKVHVSQARRESQGRWALGWIAALIAATIYALFDAGKDGALKRVVGRPVPRRHFWPSTGADRTDANAAGVVRRTVAGRAPVVLTGSPALDWRALRAWTPEALGKRISRLPQLYEHSNASFWWHDNSNLMGRRLGLRVSEPHGFAHDVPGRKFFDAEAAAGGRGRLREGGRYLYTSEKLHVPPFDALSADAEPRGFLSATADLPGGGGGQDAIFWAGDEATTAHAHYDPTHTMFVQVVGTKTFTLWPPERWPSLRLHPHGHPGHRQAQRDVAAEPPPPLRAGCLDTRRPKAERKPPFWSPRRKVEATTTSAAASSSAAEGCAESQQTTLSPGELLYVPPYWFHTVVSRSFSVAVSVVTDSRDGDRFEAACRQGLPAPLVAPDASRAARAAAARRLFVLLLRRLLPAPRRASYVHEAIVAPRLLPLGAELRCDASYDGCASAAGGAGAGAGAREDEPAADRREAELVGRIAAALAGRSSAVDGAAAVETLDGVGHIVLQDYVQHVGGYAVGVEFLCAFLRSCVDGRS